MSDPEAFVTVATFDSLMHPAEAMIGAALRAAILGFLLCPPLLHIYSLWLLAQVGQMRDPVRGGYRKTFWITAVIDAVVVMAAMALVAVVFFGAAFSGRR